MSFLIIFSALMSIAALVLSVWAINHNTKEIGYHAKSLVNLHSRIKILEN